MEFVVAAANEAIFCLGIWNGPNISPLDWKVAFARPNSAHSLGSGLKAKQRTSGAQIQHRLKMPQLPPGNCRVAVEMSNLG